MQLGERCGERTGCAVCCAAQHTPTPVSAEPRRGVSRLRTFLAGRALGEPQDACLAWTMEKDEDLLDPTPSIHDLFAYYNQLYFAVRDGRAPRVLAACRSGACMVPSPLEASAHADQTPGVSQGKHPSCPPACRLDRPAGRPGRLQRGVVKRPHDDVGALTQASPPGVVHQGGGQHALSPPLPRPPPPPPPPHSRMMQCAGASAPNP